MAKEENLKKGIRTRFQSGEEAVKQGKRGGIASGEARRKKKRMKELANLVLNTQIQDKKTLDSLKQKFPNLELEDATLELVLILEQFKKAQKGDAKAFELLRDTSGQKPVETQEIRTIDSKGYMRIFIDEEDAFAEDFVDDK